MQGIGQQEGAIVPLKRPIVVSPKSKR